MKWHIIEGSEGCEFAVRNNSVAIVVDSIRASATAAMLLDVGAIEIITVHKVEEAYSAKKIWPDALLFGERNGLPPEGFDFGNSPRDVSKAMGHRVIFTTTTGTQRTVDAWGSPAVLMGTTLNAAATAKTAMSYNKDIVLIPAGLSGDPSFNAQEDWVAASYIAMEFADRVHLGREHFDLWRQRIDDEGIETLFDTAPHADKLRAIGLESDIDFCAQIDITDAVPCAVAKNDFGIVLKNGNN